MTRPVVIKVGGSLLDWPELPDRLAAYLDDRQSRGDRLVLLAGGGPAADLIRDLDRRFLLGDLQSHHLAFHALDLTASILAALVPVLDLTDQPSDFETIWDRRRIPILAPRRFLLDDEAHSPTPLPASWDVTSDSIAARLADRLGARELVLLKSAPLRATGLSRRDAAQLGLIDPTFPDVSRDLERVVYLNLRVNPSIPRLVTR